jgi:NADH dehydrogenase [ubiquinone] 1 alpha subcomplex assembly factor 7
MALALYGPGGYYEDPPVGARGDFVTSPHVHPVFGELLARAIAALGPERAVLRLAEVGAGDGTLARQLLASLGEVDLTVVEASAGARRTLAGIEGLTVAGAIPPGTGIVIAHELLDNLPFRVARRGREVLVGVKGDRFVEVAGEPLPGAPAKGEHIEPVGAFAFIDEVAAALDGYALLIDYGAEGSTGGPLHGYRDHRLVEDVLASPGDTDITVGVDFARIASHARSRGLVAHPLLTQRQALAALGFEEWFRERLAAQHAQLDARDGLGAVRTWADKSRATLLIDPAGLGRFRWLLLSRPDLPAPAWLRDALAT